LEGILKNEEKLRAVEQLLVSLRWARGQSHLPEHAQFKALQDIAADLLARQPAQHRSVRHGIGQRVAEAVNNARPDGRYQEGYLITLAQAVIGQWRVIEYALERCEREQVE
jgi:hypothetical protein